MLSQKQLVTMLGMQNTMNATVNALWASQPWDYMRASALEAGEAIEHHGWKWWKAQKKDLPQLQMELIDIWHFYLSRFLQISQGNEQNALQLINEALNEDLTRTVFDGREYIIDKLDLLEKLDLLQGLACAKRMHLGLFFSTCQACELSVQDIYIQYIQKNTLNLFRQAHGYKQGTYHKEWFGGEDNGYLVINANKLRADDEEYAQKLWQSLEQTYQLALQDLNKS